MALSIGQIAITAALGFVAGVALFGKKKKNGKAFRCGPTEGSRWAGERSLNGLLITSKNDLNLVLPKSRGGIVPDESFTPGRNDVVITQQTCEVHKWDGSNWVVDAFLTEDFAQFLKGNGKEGPRIPGLTPSPITRPSP